MIKKTCWCIFLGSALLLTGCLSSRQDEVVAWMGREKSAAVPKIPPLQEPGVFHPIAYDRGSAEDPFAFEKLARVFADTKKKQGGASLIEKHDKRRKEPLEAYPLDSIKMVGFMQKAGTPTALLEVDKHIYQVSTGNYIGQNFGQIRQITEAQVQLNEVVQDATGEWIERSTVLELQQ